MAMANCGLHMKKQLIQLRVNGRTYELAAEPSRLVLDALRIDLGLTGSKRGCDDSSCGACTVQLDGVPVLASTMLAARLARDDEGRGAGITTDERIQEQGSLA